VTAIQPYQANNEMAIVDYQTIAVNRLADWAASAQAAYEVARRIVGTSFVPAAFKGKPDEATAAILAGLEVGLSPMSALKAFDVIQGQAAPRAITLRAVVQASGHAIWTVESTATRAIVKGQRRGGTQVETSTWTLDRAKDLQLLSKDNWKKQPQAMLLARATSECARLIAADAILGIGYSAEELADGATADEPQTSTEAVPAASSGTRRMSRPPKTTPSATPAVAAAADVRADEAERSGLDEFAPETTTNPESITAAQLTKLHICLGENGLSDRDAGLAYIGGQIGRDIESSKDLTKDEASKVIDILERLSAEPEVKPGAQWGEQ
jgi:hypothetical protein